MVPKRVLTILKTTASDWLDDRAMTMAASLAFYSVLSLAPTLLIAVSVAGLVFEEKAARGELVGELQGLIGPEGGAAIETVLASAHHPSAGIAGTIIGVVVLLFGASGEGRRWLGVRRGWLARRPGRVGLLLRPDPAVRRRADAGDLPHARDQDRAHGERGRTGASEGRDQIVRA